MDNKFNDLFILDLANNHQGDVDHAKTIIKEISGVVKRYKVKAAIKFQFRDLESFVHKDERERGKDGMVGRFLSTKLSDEESFVLKEYVDSLDLLAACTPFDEASVDKIVKMDFDYIKVASCSAQDWPLLERIRKAQMPLIVSTGGLSLEEIDELVYFISKKRKNFALMHCASIYPTPDELLNLDRIRVLSRRYPSLTIGWSTHENPDDYQTINLAYSLGARVFEKHIGKDTDKYRLNRYSATKENIGQWLNSFKEMRKKMFTDESMFLAEQKPAIRKLARGIFTKKNIEKDIRILRDDLYQAFPSAEGSIKCLNSLESVKTRRNIQVDGALTQNNTIREISRDGELERAVLRLRMFLLESNLKVTQYNHVSVSCHRGLDKFYSVGSYFIDCSTPPYIKKIIVLLPGQSHPSHKHTDRSELYSIISGDLALRIDDEAVHLKEGQKILIDKDKYHEFSSINGAIFEEISYVENGAKSEYKDDEINKIDRSERVIRIEGRIL